MPSNYLIEEGTYEHSINFDDKNTWADWHLVPTKRPTFSMPKPKTKYIDIPGGNGHIDLTEALAGYPMYENRKGSFEFLVLNGWEEWHDVYDKVKAHLHGKKLKAILNDDLAYYYEGRFEVDQWKSGRERSSIVINYDVGPYKWELMSSVDDWLWDPFNFETGAILQTICADIPVTSTTEYKYIDIDANFFDRAVVCPVFKVENNTGDIRVRLYEFDTKEWGTPVYAKTGMNQFPDIIFKEKKIRVSLLGIGTVSIIFRKGRL